MKQDEYYFEAVKSWQAANKNLKHFAECCYHVSGTQTQALAADCGCSVDTIENYRRAYILYDDLMGNEELTSDPVRNLWEKSPIALWVKAAQLHTRLNLSLEKTKDYLETASTHHMTREQMAAHVDEKENDTPKWIRRLRSAIRFLIPSKRDYKSADMPPEMQDRYNRAVSAFVSELEAIAAEAQGGAK